MKNVIVLALLAWQGYTEYRKHGSSTSSAQAGLSVPADLAEASLRVKFECDGRTHCSQMHSCEEATFFLQNCPDVKMDGNRDGVPCERSGASEPACYSGPNARESQAGSVPVLISTLLVLVGGCLNYSDDSILTHAAISWRFALSLASRNPCRVPCYTT
jgi:hypothetical protein